MTTVARDGGWGWIVCFGSFLIHLLSDGMFYSFGIIYIEFLECFGRTETDTAWIISMPPGICLFVGPVVAFLANKYGCRVVVITGSLVISASFIISTFVRTVEVMYLSLGLMGGIGFGMVYLPSIIIVCQYFDKKRAMATGLAVSGTGIGTFIFGPLSDMLIDLYTWKGVLLIYAALVLHCLPIGMMYRPIQQPITCTAREHKRTVTSYGGTQTGINGTISHASTGSSGQTVTKDDESYWNLSQDKEFGSSTVKDTLRTLRITIVKDYIGLLLRVPTALLYVSLCLNMMFFLVPNFYLPARAVSAGIPEGKAAWLVSAIGISSTVSRAGFGWVSDKPCTNRVALCATAITVCGLCTAVGPQFSSFEVLLAYAIVYGLTNGLIVSLLPVLLVDFVGIEKLAAALGMCNMFGGVATVMGTPLVGWLFDVTGSYSLSFLTAGTSFTSAGIILYLTFCVKSNKHTLLNETTY